MVGKAKLFEQTSRYFNLKNITYIKKGEKEDDYDTHIIVYKERRFIPQIKQMITLQDVTVMAGERLDNLTFRTIGDPEQFWRICDANGAMHPLEMMKEAGKVLHIGVPNILR